jgi:hypothetical protein
MALFIYNTSLLLFPGRWSNQNLNYMCMYIIIDIKNEKNQYKNILGKFQYLKCSYYFIYISCTTERCKTGVVATHASNHNAPSIAYICKRLYLVISCLLSV